MDRNLHLTDVLRVRESFPEFARLARELVERRGAAMVLAEANGPQKGVFDQFREACRQPVVAVERSTDKHLRAAASQPFVAAGKLSFPQGQNGQVAQAFAPVVDEMLSFPAGSHDDCVDCVVDLCTLASQGAIVSQGGAMTVATRAERIFGNRGIKRRMFA
jgi:predicted phage terminase large subunit-like protein